jgi:hypothetical protein
MINQCAQCSRASAKLMQAQAPRKIGARTKHHTREAKSGDAWQRVRAHGKKGGDDVTLATPKDHRSLSAE